MCDMNFQWYSLHPSISSHREALHLDCGLSAWASTSRVDRLGIPVLLLSVPSWYGDTKDQRADLRCSHQEFRHSASRLPKAAVAWWAWTVQCFFGLNAAPIVTLTCDEMNYIVDSVAVGALRRSWKMSGFLRQVKDMQSFVLAPPSSVGFPLFAKIVSARTEQDGFFDFRGMYPAKTPRLRAADRVLRFSKQERARVHRTGFPHATKTFRSPD